MVQNIVERVGKAIMEESMNFGALIHRLEGKHSLESRLARAAILETLHATREPSEGMIDAGGDVDTENGPWVVPTYVGNKVAANVWRAMIDAQIKEMEEAG